MLNLYMLFQLVPSNKPFLAEFAGETKLFKVPAEVSDDLFFGIERSSN